MPGSVLAWLYRNEINCRIESFFDAGWTAQIGDDRNGWRAKAEAFYDLNEMAVWLRDTALRLYPALQWVHYQEDKHAV